TRAPAAAPSRGPGESVPARGASSSVTTSASPPAGAAAAAAAARASRSRASRPASLRASAAARRRPVSARSRSRRRRRASVSAVRALISSTRRERRWAATGSPRRTSAPATAISVPVRTRTSRTPPPRSRPGRRAGPPVRRARRAAAAAYPGSGSSPASRPASSGVRVPGLRPAARGPPRPAPPPAGSPGPPGSRGAVTAPSWQGTARGTGSGSAGPGHAQDVPDPRHGVDEARPAVVELAAQPADAGLDDRLAAGEVVLPDVVEDLPLGQHPAGVEQQVPQQRELGGGEVDRDAAAPDLPGVLVELQVGERQPRPLPRAGAGAAQDGADARVQLLQAERLGDVVVAAGGQPLQLVLGGVAGGEEHRRGRAAAAPEPGAGVDARAVRQRHVQDE